MDLSKYSKPTLKLMLQDPSMVEFHPAIQLALTPPPKVFVVDEGKTFHGIKKANLSVVSYTKGYVKIEADMKNRPALLYADEAVELIALLEGLIADGRLRDYTAPDKA